MHALIVVAHHDPQSLTHSVAAEVGTGLSASGHTFAQGLGRPRIRQWLGD